MYLVRYHSDDASASAIVVKEGTKLLHLIQIDASGLRIRRVSKEEARHFYPMEYRGKPYPLKRAVAAYKRAGKRFGITKSARQALCQH